MPVVSTWCVGNFNQPVYYDYGENIYFEGDNVVYEGDTIATTEQYIQQAQDLAASVPEAADPNKVEWLPLGVFALGGSDGDVEESTLFLQLAVSKEGIIAGTFQNTATDKAFEVEGMVDSKTQRTAWGPVGEKWPIMETSLFNLTENEASALLHFEDGSSQQWTLVRLDDPQSGEQK